MDKKCPYCGKKLKKVKDPLSSKKDIFLYKCKCLPKNCFFGNVE
jgi:hypothetical protein